MHKRKSWREKLASSNGLPRTGQIDSRMTKRWGEGTMVIPAPIEVDAVMRQPPKGKLTTIDQIQRILAARHRVTIACPVTTGIFAWIAAHAAAEAADEGKVRITPYWRTLKSTGELNPKYPGGIAGLKRRLSAEGHKVVKKGARFFVQDFEKKLMRARN